MLGAGNRDAFGHVDALFPGLLVVVQGVLVVVQAEQGELIQGYLQGSLVVQCISLDAAVGEERAGHLCDFAALRDRIQSNKRKEGKKGVNGGERKVGKEEGRGTGPGVRRQLVSANQSVRLRGERKTVQGRSYKKNPPPPLFSRFNLDVPVQANPGCAAARKDSEEKACLFQSRVGDNNNIPSFLTKGPSPAGFPQVLCCFCLSPCRARQRDVRVTSPPGQERCGAARSFAYPQADWLDGRWVGGVMYKDTPTSLFSVSLFVSLLGLFHCVLRFLYWHL